MPLHLFDPLKDLTARVRSGRRVVLFSDFDGTLAPICDRPMAVEASPEVRGLLGAIAARAGVAVVSGRELADLRPRVGVEGIAYAGNHGLEIIGPGFEFREPGAVAHSRELAVVVAELTAELAGVPGAWVQNKELTASVHYRQVDPALVPRVTDAVKRVVGPHRDRFVVRGGKMVLEVRPDVDWHKGRAVHWLWEKLGGAAGSVSIYLGDDATDEDAFAALPDGVTVMVGPSRSTVARYRLDEPAEVTEFLRRLATVLGVTG